MDGREMRKVRMKVGPLIVAVVVAVNRKGSVEVVEMVDGLREEKEGQKK
jgi:hypothetical protein